LIASTVCPDSGPRKRGKTVRLALLDQQGDQLAPITGAGSPRCWAGCAAVTGSTTAKVAPAQLPEQLGFAHE
jgi:ATP-binding cassette subfamily F protein uup